MSHLKNPGHEAPKLLEFDCIPSLFEFLRFGGVPGVEYLYVAAQNQPKAQSEGFTQIVGMPYFNIGGIGSTLMARGKPLRDTPAQPGTSKCSVFCDEALLVAVGQSPAVVVETLAASAPSPAPQPTSKAPKHEPARAELLGTK